MKEIKAIIDARDYYNMTSSPEWGEYVITTIQQGNLHGEKGWMNYIGYVAQIRKKAGAFGSDLILLRHPNGKLVQHHNQSFCRPNEFWLKKIKALFPKNMTPDEYEDYTEPYTLGDGKSPETGKVIEFDGIRDMSNDNPMMQITINHSDGSKTVEVV